MSETIVLPRSGVVLTRTTLYEDGLAEYELSVEHVGEVMLRVASDARTASAFFGDDYCGGVPTQDAVEWMDECVLALRAALMPADAKTRVTELVLHAWFGFTPDQSNEAEIADARMLADAILAALAGGAS